MSRTVPHTGPYDSDFDDPLFDVDLETYPPDREERSTAVIAHLSGLFTILGPILVYFLKRDDSAYVEGQAAEALNFQITVAIAAVVFGVLCIVLVGIPLLLGLVLAAFVLPIPRGDGGQPGRALPLPAHDPARQVAGGSGRAVGG